MLDGTRSEHDAYTRAAEAIARARDTEGTTEEGLWRTAVVESAAAITEALFDLSDSVSRSGGLADEQELYYRLSGLGDIAAAIQKLAPPSDS